MSTRTTAEPPLRMRDLVREAGVPASTIHHYIREELLPEPERPTANSALYDRRHLEALRAIRRIRELDPDLSLASVKRVAELVAGGIEPEVAVSLRRAVTGPESAGSRLSAAELAERAGITEAGLGRYVRRGVVVPAPSDDGPWYDEADLRVVEAVAELEGAWPTALETVSRVSALVREASALEMALRNEMVTDAAQAAELSRQLQEWANLWHSYLFTRYRLLEIRRFGLGPGLP